MPPTPQPTALRIMRGNPGKRPLNKNEPQPQATRPEMPDKVKANVRASQEWNRLVPILERMRVLTEADGIALGALCMAVALEDDVHAKINATGLLVETKRTGMIHVNPLLKVRESAEDRVYRYLREFGLSPSSRSGIQRTDTEASDDGWSNF